MANGYGPIVLGGCRGWRYLAPAYERLSPSLYFPLLTFHKAIHIHVIPPGSHESLLHFELKLSVSLMGNESFCKCNFLILIFSWLTILQVIMANDTFKPTNNGTSIALML